MSESREAKVIYGFNITPVKLSMDLSELELILTLKRATIFRITKEILRKRTKWEVSCFLISSNTINTKLKQPKQHGIGMETDIYTD